MRWPRGNGPGWIQRPGNGMILYLERFVLLSTIIVTVSCQPKPLAFSENIGIVSMTAGKGCFAVSNPSIPENSQIRIVEMTGGQASPVARVAKKDPSCSNSVGNTPAVVAYDVYFDRQPPGELPAIGLLNYQGKIVRDGGLVSADINGDGQREYFRSCISTEGVHFTVWSGKPMVGTRRWHQYYYLGYDVSPTCTDAETKQD